MHAVYYHPGAEKSEHTASWTALVKHSINDYLIIDFMIWKLVSQK
jgi:hypothetical protein